ncbi:MAG: nucleoside triphosphate pyrophosphohydrolase [Thermodesulfobacteriota bacterium]
MRDNKKIKKNFFRLVEIMDRLRAPEGCPWDRKQSAETVKNYLLEEAYEVVAAVEDSNPGQVCEELGDLLFLIIFLSLMYEEQAAFNINDVMESIAAKIIRRHPHVFGAERVACAEEVRDQWHKIKREEARLRGEEESLFASVPRNLPALLRAQRIGARAARTGFDWENADSVWEKLDEELSELKKACAINNPARIRDELGDVLFTLVNLSRHLHVNAEEALRLTVDRFIRRFDKMQGILEKDGRPLEEFTLEEMDAAWEKVKNSV